MYNLNKEQQVESQQVKEVIYYSNYDHVLLIPTSYNYKNVLNKKYIHKIVICMRLLL